MLASFPAVRDKFFQQSVDGGGFPHSTLMLTAVL